MKVWTLWEEGYVITGNSSRAKFLGNFEAETFEEACDMYAATLPDEDRERHYKKEPYPAYWGCRIYDNEYDARFTFG